MKELKIKAGPFDLVGRLELEKAPQTCAAFLKALPFVSEVIHVRWSGEGVWMPLGDLDFGVGYENHTSYPAPGQMILYRAASARPRSCSPMAACISPARSANSPATTSSPSPPASSTSTTSAA